MQNLMPFAYRNHAIRVIRNNENGEPWFVAVDVCKVLELNNPTRALERLDDDEKTQVIDPATLNSNQGTGINNLLNVVNEPGLYRLIFTSRKPEANTFKRWIVHDVLPSIRKTGSYALPDKGLSSDKVPLREVARKNREIADLAQSYSTLYRVMGLRGTARQTAVETVLRARHGIELDRIAPMPCPVQHPVKNTTIEDRLVSPTEIGQMLGGKTGHQVNLILEAQGLQVRDGKNWKPTSKAQGLWEWVKVAMHRAPFLRWRENAILKQLESVSNLLTLEA
ncbi:BRO family protein [Acidithiobacillus thiooxidans]|uniref:BRO-N domain-containing protein n=1 Tax=Acidithiobacillus thiooxidans TaxID=930 RepID=UPI0028567DD6|nr:BRO family protein [Acidithiobacillus thiooxidans]MDR7926435.1 BRO family protein [Acidithiobacillus thiooxidans]